jgi:hypothetical protein
LKGIDDGTIDPTFVAPYYRFEECGVGEKYYSGVVYSRATRSSRRSPQRPPCFQKYVAEARSRSSNCLRAVATGLPRR